MIKFISYTWITVLTANLIATSGDIAATWSSPILPKLHSNDSNINPFDKPITDDEESWLGSLLNIGAMIGPFLYGFIAEKFGRKISLLCIAIPHIVSYLTFAFSRTIELYYFARFFGGIAVGGGYTIFPMYVAEVAEDSNRGMLSSTLNVFCTFGSLLPYVIGPYVPVTWFNVILTCVPVIFFVLFSIIGPETPYYLIEKNKMNKAEKSLMKLRSYDANVVAEEIRKIKSELEANEDNTTLMEFFSSKVYMKGLLISCVLIIAQQLSGINAVLFYTQDIFEAAGANGLSTDVSSIIVGVVLFASSFVTPFLSDRFGRRILMLVSLLGVTVSHLAFGVYFYLKSSDSDVSSISWLPIVSLVAYIIMFNLALGPVAWTIATEIFPTSVKSYAASIYTFMSYLFSFAVTKTFSDLEEAIGQGETFWLFSGCCFAAFLFTYFFVPETKGKSFQEIQDILHRQTLVITCFR